MLKEYNKITIPVIEGEALTLEVNFSEDNSIVKINRDTILKMEELYKFLMIAGNEDIQVGLMPIQQKEVKHIEKMHNVVVNRDIKKGERLKVHCEFDVETAVYEGLVGLAGKPQSPPRSRSQILVPGR